VSLLGDAESSLGFAKSSLGDAKSSLGDAKSSLGDAKSLLGDAKSLLGDVNAAWMSWRRGHCMMRHGGPSTSWDWVRRSTRRSPRSPVRESREREGGGSGGLTREVETPSNHPHECDRDSRLGMLIRAELVLRLTLKPTTGTDHTAD
jgi:hypothetical protein